MRGERKDKFRDTCETCEKAVPQRQSKHYISLSFPKHVLTNFEEES